MSRRQPVEPNVNKDAKMHGRSSISNIDGAAPTHPANEQSMKTEVNRGITSKGNMGKHRGDRRDMSPTYTNNAKHAAHAGSPRKDVSTRKR